MTHLHIKLYYTCDVTINLNHDKFADFIDKVNQISELSNMGSISRIFDDGEMKLWEFYYYIV